MADTGSKFRLGELIPEFKKRVFNSVIIRTGMKFTWYHSSVFPRVSLVSVTNVVSIFIAFKRRVSPSDKIPKTFIARLDNSIYHHLESTS